MSVGSSFATCAARCFKFPCHTRDKTLHFSFTLRLASYFSLRCHGCVVLVSHFLAGVSWLCLGCVSLFCWGVWVVSWLCLGCVSLFAWVPGVVPQLCLTCHWGVLVLSWLCLGCVWVESGLCLGCLCLGRVWAVSGLNLGCVWVVSGSRLGRVWDWYSWHFRLCLWQKVSAEEQGKWKSVSPKLILFSDEIVAAYFDWQIGTKDSTCVVEITAANFAAFLCFDLPNKILDFASKCFQFRWIQLDFRTKQIPVFFACWYHSLELLLFSLIFAHVFGSLLLPGIAAGRR